MSKSHTPREWAALAILALGVVACLTLPQMVWAKYLYGDWRCAFAECRIEVPAAQYLQKGEREDPW